MWRQDPIIDGMSHQQPSWASQDPQAAPPHYYPQPQQPPKKKGFLARAGIGCGGLMAAVIIIGGIAAVATDTEDDNDSTEAADTEQGQDDGDDTSDEAPEPEGPVTEIESGTYLVGEDIEPGEYATDGPVDRRSCYWARTSDSSGELDAVLANDNIEGPSRVTVNDGEYLETSGDCTWSLT